MNRRPDLFAPLRVLLVTETYPPEINGVAMTTGRMVAGLRARGHWVGVVRPRRHGGEKDCDLEWGVTGISLPNYPEVKLGLPHWRRINQLIRTHKPDLVHVVTEGPLGWAALLAARHLGLPVTSGYHTHFDQYSSHYGMAWLTPLVTRWLDALHRRCQATLVPAPELAETLRARGIPNVQVVGRGVDTALFTPDRRDPALRQSWGLEADADTPPACLFVGRLAPEKNLAAVVHSHAAIAARHPGAPMVWVGDGPALAGLKAAHPDHFFAGPRIGEDLARHYASADLFLFPSLSETWGNVIGEAMASGLGVVAYDRAAAATLIRDGENGRAPAPGDEQAFIEAALSMAGDAEHRRALGLSARETTVEISWEQITSRLEAVLREAQLAQIAARS
ncbi:MAG: glycosyltransferase family 1 protein [Pseudomonadota bacterium]